MQLLAATRTPFAVMITDVSQVDQFITTGAPANATRTSSRVPRESEDFAQVDDWRDALGAILAEP
jgi:hypothetical protein